jgi:4'-phosphopantetheinyl transferase
VLNGIASGATGRSHGEGLALGYRAAPCPPAPPSGDIQVWTVPLDAADWQDLLTPERLSPDDLARLRRFPFERERRRFAVSRAAVRAILGGHLGVPPGELTFHQGPHGKPRLAPRRDEEPVRFNVSHSYELALVAISGERELGVDLERVRPLPDLEGIVAHWFGPAERAAFEGLDPGATLRAFYRHWTLKEAYLKACGLGLSHAPAIDVADPWRRPIRLPDVAGESAHGFWTGDTFEPAPGYAASLVVEGSWDGSVVPARFAPRRMVTAG